MEPRTRRRALLAALTLALLAFAAFIPILRNGFVAWDDDLNFLQNAAFRGLGAGPLKWAWTTGHLGVYQPLGWILFSVQYMIFGLEPWGYHLTSILLHAANAVALFFLTLLLLERADPDRFAKSRPLFTGAAALAAALYAVHPLRTEAVAWISCQPYLPSTLCSLLCLITYLRQAERAKGAVGRLAMPLFFFTAALLFKAVAAGIAGVLVLLDFYPRRRLAWLEKLPFVALAGGTLLLAYWAKADLQDLFPLKQDGFLLRVSQASHSAWFYLAKSVLPFGITAYYPFPSRLELYSPSFLLPLGALAVATATVCALRRRWPGLFFAWVAYLLVLAPTSGLLRISNSMAADRYSYLALAVWAIPLAWLFGTMVERAASRFRLAIGPAAVVAVMGLAALSWSQCAIWHDGLALWSHAAAHGGADDAEVQYNLGTVLGDAQRFPDAITHFRKALDLYPDYPHARSNLGAAYLSTGQTEEGYQQYLRALELAPDSAKSHFGLGMALSTKGKPAEALEHFEIALRVEPALAAARCWRIETLVRLGRADEAKTAYAEAKKLDPEYFDSRCNPTPPGANELNERGISLARAGRTAEAIAEFRRALEQDPEFVRSRFNLGNALAIEGKTDDAISELSRALKLDPNDADAHRNLGTLLALKGRRREAAVQFSETLRIRPGDANAKRELLKLRRR